MMPAGPDGENISRLDTLLLAINPSTVHGKEAWEMLKLLTGDEAIQSEIFTYSEGVPVLREVVEAEENQKFFASESDSSHVLNLPMLSHAVEQAVVIPRFHNYDNAVSEVDRAIQAILQSNSNINMETIIQNRKINHYLNH
jgi:multiple sugar transport system substrate-binding protein